MSCDERRSVLRGLPCKKLIKFSNFQILICAIKTYLHVY